MPFKLIFSRDSSAEIKKLENVVVKRILDKLDSTLGEPNNFFERLSGREEYKLRIGDYRAIARIFQNEKTIFIMSIGHRKNIYKKINRK
jgi:mRNA interferase RelE/StbE